MSAESGSQKRQDGPREVVAGRYELTQRLARGGMGEVFAAQDRSTGRAVALKRLLANAQAQRGQVVHFMREYHALSELRHPRIIEVYEYGVDRDVPYYTMELLDGQDLRDLSPLPYREACLYLRDVASSLALLHARRLLHRDVSPRNVRRTSDGHCKLLDFGAMIPFGVPPNVTGTAPCIPPEALQGTALDQRADLYSLGAVAYSLLTGKHGYAVSQLDELPSAWRRPMLRPKRVASIPDELDELVMSLMSLDPMKRPKSAAEVIDWLSAIGQLAPDDAAGVARAFFTSTPLCGRSLQSDELARRIQRVARGKGGAVILEGMPGTGKSRTLAEAGLIAQTCGVTALHAVARRQRGASYTLAHELITAAQQLMPMEAEQAGASKIAWPRPQESSGQQGDPAEQRARLQQALGDVFARLARQRPVLVTVDDLERADEPSCALIAGLAHEAGQLPLLLVASYTSGSSDSAPEVAAYRSVASAMRLMDLSRTQSQELVLSMFGHVPNIELLGEWLFRVARGNPKLTLELAEHLYKQGLVRYVDGAWTVPSEEITLELPADLSQTWELRLQGSSRAARDLAELLSVRRGGVSVEICVAAAGGKPDATFAALDELVRGGVLESAGSDYVFAQDVLRKALEQRLSPERVRELHRRWADVLLAEAGSDLDVRLEAGWHLVHTDAELRGADILTEVAPVYVDRAMSMGMAIPALEKALEVYERLERPLEARLRLRSALVLAGYLYDYRLAFRYGERTLAMLHEVSGLSLASRLGRYLGKPLALLVAVVLTMLRRLWTPKLRRGPPVYTALRYFGRAAMGLMGVRATSLDPEGAWAIFRMVEPLGGAPGPTSGRIIYLACRSLATQMLGREADLKRFTDQALHELRRGRRRDMSEMEYRALLVGLLMADGVNESYREESQALARADMLEGVGTLIAYAGALRIRTIYYARRGDVDRAEHYRRLIDLHAIQGGTVWQGEWFSVPLEGLAGAAWTDLVTLRRSLERLNRLVADVPALGNVRDGIRISYHFRRGEYARAAELGAQYVAEHPPRTLVGWPATYGVVALSFVEVGEATRARRLCEDALAHVSEEDLSYFVMYGALEVAYATALAVCGELERGKALLRKRIERIRKCGEHSSLVLMYQYQARMAQLLGDRELLTEALQAMREAALTSGLPAVILLADRVAELRARRRSSPLPPPSGPLDSARPRPNEQISAPPRPSTQPAEETAVTAFLQRVPSGKRRSRDALWLLARYMCCEEAFLYRLAEPSVLSLMASIPEEREAPGLMEELVKHVSQLSAAQPLSVSVMNDVDSGEDRSVARYRVLAITAPGADAVLGAVALREGAETLQEVSDEMLTEISQVLAEDLRAEPSPTSLATRA